MPRVNVMNLVADRIRHRKTTVWTALNPRIAEGKSGDFPSKTGSRLKSLQSFPLGVEKLVVVGRMPDDGSRKFIGNVPIAVDL